MIWFIIWLVVGLIFAVAASEEGKSGCLVFLLIFLGGPIGLIIWLLIRDR